MKNRKEIHLDKENSGLRYEFLANGDIVACHNRTILIYSSNDNWKCREYKLKNVDKISEIVANDKLLVSVNENLFILDLSTFQYWKVLLDKNVSIFVWNSQLINYSKLIFKLISIGERNKY